MGFIKVTQPSNSPLWVNVSSIKYIAAQPDGWSKMYFITGDMIDVKEDARSLIEQIRRGDIPGNDDHG